MQKFDHVPIIRQAMLVAAVAFPAAVQAHTTYGGSARDFGVFDRSGGTTVIENQAVSGGFGWADASDSDWGDAHRTRAFKLELTEAAVVTLTAEAYAGATATSIGGLLPGVSIYSGLFHETGGADYDYAQVTLDWQAANGLSHVEGALNALGDFAMGNDAGDLSFLTYVGNVADGSASNFGGADGIHGDGLADGVVTGMWTLGPGSYSIVIGGADYASQTLESTPFPAYGLRATLSVSAVPEPETHAMMLAGLGLLGALARRRSQKR